METWYDIIRRIASEAEALDEKQSAEIKRLRSRLEALEGAARVLFVHARCRNLAHAKSEHHENDQPCPVMDRIRTLLDGK